ncbi:DUF3099 domain-containing protein [Actinomadura flavalba]|uniref:DUF3099 domain-containing protein n=1 Tax=Actinomadura flavalba TaxID=1120938 RepID=UPI000365F80A|nr:DUF3099 domain-containing protein [Actinomadura flavalba]
MRRRTRTYLIMMGCCLALFVGAWAVVVRFSPLAAVLMSVVAAVIPPIAVIIANGGRER